MISVGIHEAKTTLSLLIRRVSNGDEVTITNNGQPVARLVAIVPPTGQRIGGAFAGRIEIPDDFDEPIHELTEYFS